MYDLGLAKMKHDRETENPFYHNYVFSRKDLARRAVRKPGPSWWFAKKYVQVSEGYAFHFKLRNDGCILLYKVEKVADLPPFERIIPSPIDDPDNDDLL